MPRRRKDKVDENQPEIVKQLRKIHGVTVEPGHDDVLVGFMGQTYWFEIKSGDALSKRTGEVLHSKKQKHQRELEQSWAGHYQIVSTLDEILDAINML